MDLFETLKKNYGKVIKKFKIRNLQGNKLRLFGQKTENNGS